MDKFTGIPRMYNADEVDSEIAILKQSRDFWKKRAEELSKKYELGYEKEK